MPAVEKIYYINRATHKTEEERIYCEAALRFLYGSKLGKSLATLLAYIPLFSQLFGWWQRKPWTKKKIVPFITQYQVDTAHFEKPAESYTSFDDFFTRTLKKDSRPLAPGAIIPADGRYLFYQDLSSCDGFVIKGKKFSLERLVGEDSLTPLYSHGSMVIARLCPSDYHRFHFPVDCTPSQTRLINGPLYSVNPLAVRQNVTLLTENKRTITRLKTDHYGTILFIEIGATNVGSIHQTFSPGTPYKKGDEKGYFSFGGSSLILLFEKGKIRLANDVLSHSADHMETLCLMGQSMEERLIG